METTLKVCLFALAIVLLLPIFPATSLDGGDSSAMQTYIVRVRPPPRSGVDASIDDLKSWYRSFLPVDTANSTADRMVYMYRDAIIGFAARLTESEVVEMAKKDGFLKAYQDRQLPLATTHTPAFLGLQQSNGFWNGSSFGKGVIIGVLDTGLAAKHPSFNDHGMPPPPPKWNGSCESNWTPCNKKLIGAKSFGLGSVVSDDPVGHGTHTASTAAGNFVKKANVLGIGSGTAVGMAPRAHLAVYRVCSDMGCMTADVMAGMDAAIADGVDVMSLSLGGPARPFYDDVIAIGAFSAVQKGIFVSCAAGNSGPDLASVTNDAPWILTVGASTMDRNIRSTVKLGDGQEIDGETAFQPRGFPATPLPLVYPSPPGGPAGGNCYAGALDGINVKGKVVACQRSFGPRMETGSTVKAAGGAAMILLNQESNGYTTFADAHLLPASHVSYDDGRKIKAYIDASNHTGETPNASIVFKGTITGVSPAPTVADFSSRGPSTITPGILKPDIIGPGVNVLAAWPFHVGPPSSKRPKVNFNIISGTSMATPHLSGIAALVKGKHRDWSPAAIRSAIMTTSDKVSSKDGKPINDEKLQPASFLHMGAGHVNPSKAANPGFVYDLGVDDYIAYLCGMGYTDDQMESVAGHKVSCANIKKISEAELNYPSIMVAYDSKEAAVNRTVTYVGKKGAITYKASVEMPSGVEVSVLPETLEFAEAGEKKSFVVKMDWSKSKISRAEGNLEWVSEKHVVRSPIVIN